MSCKKIFAAILLASPLALMTDGAAAAGFTVERIDPPHWWVGMNDNSLQLQVQGRDVRSADFTVDWPGVTVDSVIRLDGSPDWQYIYLTLSPTTPAGELTLTWKEGKEKVRRKYELRKRTRTDGAAGFSSADVLYLVMPDRFADGDPSNNSGIGLQYPVGADRSDPNARHGGDISGLLHHVDYIDSLGVTAVWVNPVLENDMPGGSYHGYATTDYYRIDPRFGTNQEYTALIDTLHGRDIKTVMDMIFNHVGSEHPWRKNPPASDWFNLQDEWQQTNYRLSTLTDPYASDRDRRLTVDGWFVREMPDLNQRNPHLMKYLVQNSIWWIEESGIDGIRMDTYSYADRDAMRAWIEAVEKEYPEFSIVGECWLSDPGAESAWQTGSKLGEALGSDTGLRIVMDFPLMIKSRDMAPFRENTNSWQGLNTLYDHLALDFLYPDPDNLLRFLDNHDTERFIVEMPSDLGGWKQAMTFLLTVPGIPQIYYGTELLMSGTREGGDGNVRRDMPGGFPGDTTSIFTREGRTPMQNEAFDFLSSLLKWRKGSKAVAGGSMRHFLPDNGLYVWQRVKDGEEVVVMLNGTDSELTADMSRYSEILTPGTTYIDVLTGEECVPLSAGEAMMAFPPRGVKILERR